MSIEEQIAALEARIQACMALCATVTEQAELAASRAELAAQRAELAALGSQEAEVASVVAAEISAVEAEVASVEAEVAVEAAAHAEIVVEEVTNNEEVIEEDAENSESEIPVYDRREGQEDETGEPGLQPGPIVIKVEEHHRAEPTLFKRNNTRFRRGRAS